MSARCKLWRAEKEEEARPRSLFKGACPLAACQVLGIGVSWAAKGGILGQMSARYGLE